MSHIEFCAKLKIRDGQLANFKQRIDGINAAAKMLGAAMLRSDWFVNDSKLEAASMTVYRDEVALQAHHAAAAADFTALTSCCDGTVEFFGTGPTAVPASLATFNPRAFRFAYGINAGPTPIAATKPGARGIEIYSKFNIFPGQLDAFIAVGAELLPIIRSKDPGTTRYDWFYDDANLQCVAMDCYADTPSMFAHMKNAHDVHEKLYDYSTMVTEFQGELPDEAKAAVARYDPNILPLYSGLK